MVLGGNGVFSEEVMGKDYIYMIIIYEGNLLVLLITFFFLILWEVLLLLRSFQKIKN